MELVEEFGFYLLKKQKASKNTVLSYSRDVELFISRCGLQSADECLTATRGQIQEYIDGLEREGKAVSTVLRSASSIRNFYSYLISRRLLTENPAAELELPAPEHKAPVILTPGEINKLLAQPNAEELKGARDKAMLELLYATGMKVSELISLELKDVDVEDGAVLCKGGARPRMIPMGAAAEEAVSYYIANVRELMVENQKIKTLFVNCGGQPMTRQGFWKLIKGYIAGAGIEKDVTPQTLRHSFAVHLLQNGADVEAVSQMLGYNDTVSTRIYSDMLKDRIKKVYNRSHPRA